MSGTATHREDLYEVLTKRGHQIIPLIEDPHDFAYTYNLEVSAGAPSLLHIHNYDIGHLEPRLSPDKFYSVNSEFQKQQFYLLNNFDPGKIFVLSNYVNEKKYTPAYTPKKNKSIILLGRVQESNFDRIRTTILALQYLPEYTLDIVGWVSNTGKTLVRDLIKETGATNIHLIGELRGQEKIDFICSHEVGIGVGRAMMEMSLLGLPVLVYGHSWGGWVTPELIDKLRFDNFSTRSLEKMGDEELVERILTHIKDPHLLNRAVAFEEFGLFHNVWRYESVFDKIVDTFVFF